MIPLDERHIQELAKTAFKCPSLIEGLLFYEGVPRLRWTTALLFYFLLPFVPSSCTIF